jgi:hypothetical protein
VQANEICIPSRPVLVAIPHGKRFLERLERFRFFPQDAVGAGGIVKRAGITGTQRDRGLQVPQGFVLVFFEIRELGSQQDARPHVFRHNLELLAERFDKSFGDVVCLFLPPKIS